MLVEAHAPAWRSAGRDLSEHSGQLTTKPKKWCFVKQVLQIWNLNADYAHDGYGYWYAWLGHDKAKINEEGGSLGAEHVLVWFGGLLKHLVVVFIEESKGVIVWTPVGLFDPLLPHLL
jgi:hypothetical protein